MQSQILLIPLVAMVIPIALLVGQRLRGGPLVALNGGALLVLAIFWLLEWNGWNAGVNPSLSFASVLALVVGVLLLLGGWTLALADAARARRWGWLALLILSTYASVAAMVGFLAVPQTTCGSTQADPATCAPTNLGLQATYIAVSLVAPIVGLAYALRIHSRVASVALDGLTVSPLSAPDDERADAVSREKL